MYLHKFYQESRTLLFLDIPLIDKLSEMQNALFCYLLNGSNASFILVSVIVYKMR